MLADLRRAAERRLPQGTDAIADSAPSELDACALAAAGRWADASKAAIDAAAELGKGGDPARGYRALWLYLAGVWADQAGDEAGDPGGRRTARALGGSSDSRRLLCVQQPPLAPQSALVTSWAT